MYLDANSLRRHDEYELSEFTQRVFDVYLKQWRDLRVILKVEVEEFAGILDRMNLF